MNWLKKWFQRRKKVREFRRGLEELVENMRKDGHTRDDCCAVLEYIGGVRKELPAHLLTDVKFNAPRVSTVGS